MIPKHIILSRKGFDASLGGHPSPIFDNGTIVSIPIPEGRNYPEGPNSRVSYEEIDLDGMHLGPLVEGLTGKRVLGSDWAHLDPDLRDAAIHRRTVGWLASF